MMLLGLNIALLGIIGYLGYLLKITPASVRYVTRPQYVTNTVRQIAVRKVNATNLLAALAGRLSSWAAIESTNYVTYIANLRAFSVPEETIKDIILTDIAKAYARRRAQIQTQAGAFRFWQTSETGSLGEVTDPRTMEQLAALKREQDELVRELLGVDFDMEMARYSAEHEYEDMAYSFLPAEKRDRLSELQSRYEQLEQQIYERSKGFLLDSDQETLRQLERQRDAELAQVLTTEELEEYQLRMSPTSASLRAQLHGFNPSEEEFRKVFRLQKAFDEQFNAFNLTDPNQAEVQAAAQERAELALNEEIRKTLGNERYAQLQIEQDADMKALDPLLKRFEAPPQVKNRVYNMKMEAERRKLEVESNQNLTPEERAQTLAAIARETERSVAQVMGGANSQLWQAYQRNASWINGLSYSDFALSAEPEPQQQIVAPPPPPGLPLPFTFPPPPIPIAPR
jgi:hypothetical protein